MEIRDASSMAASAETVAHDVKVTQLYPTGQAALGLVAVHLWEIGAGGSTPLHSHGEEHVLFVLSGVGELSGGPNTSTSTVRAESVVHIAPNEPHSLRNTGRELLRAIVSTPLLVRSERSLGMPTHRRGEAPAREAVQPRVAPPAEAPSVPAVTPPPQPTEENGRGRGERNTVREPEAPPVAEAPTEPAPAQDDEAAPPIADISSLMKRASELPKGQRPERRRPEPAPQPEAVPEEPEQAEDAEAPSSMLELQVVFDGGSRGNPGQGYGSYLVQSPGRRPVIKRVEFGDNYTNNQAEYDTLIACLEYITERLTVTGRTPQQVQLDIKSDSDLLVNQLNGTFKVKDAGVRVRHTKAAELLGTFSDWMLEWHPSEESVRLLGH